MQMRFVEMEEKSEMESRKDKRKVMKKLKRKERRKEIAEKERLEEEGRLNDPEELRKRLLLEQLEAERIERDRIAFQEREKAWIIKQQQQREQEELSQHHNNYNDNNNDLEEEDALQEEEDGPPEIIWLGNEIIIKKKKKKLNPDPLLLHNHQEQHEHCDDDNNNRRPTSNPFPPESPSQPATLENVTQQLPNFGTELDKAHCPFHFKTAACRFGDRCSRVHYYPDKSCTLLIRNMYNGPGLAWDQDEGLEYTDEEVERCFEEFYEDVHTEFLKFGEIVNFKVCKNGSFHLRGNVYVQYKLLDSALLAYNSVNGRYFAGKQVSCKFVNLTRWKVAICGEYMKSGYKTCSHGTACNFIHCFRNPGGDYEWADSDKPPPKFWVKEMVALFGHSDDCEISRVHGKFSALKHSSNVLKADSDRYSRRSRSREMGQLNGGRSSRRKQEDERKQRTPDEEGNTNFKDNHKRKYRNKTPDSDSDREGLEEVDRKKHHEHTRKSSFNRNKGNNSRRHEEYSDVDKVTINTDNEKQHDRKGRNSQTWNRDSRDWTYEAGSDEDRDGDRRRHHSSRRKGSRHQSRDNSNVTDESESDKDRGHEEYSDVDWDTLSRDNEKKHGSKGRNSQKWNKDSRYRIYEAGSDEDRQRKRLRSSQRRKGSRHQSRDNSNVTDESESNKDRDHEEYSDVDWDTISRDNEKQHGSKGRNSQKRNGNSRYQIDEAGSDEDRHRKKHRSSQMKESRHQSGDSSYGIDESDKDREMETQHDYSRKSSRHRRSGLQDYCDDCENENDKVDGGWSQRDGDRRAHHDKKKRLKYQKKLDSTNGDTKNVSHENSGELLSGKNPSEDRHEHSKGSDNHV